MKFNLRNAAAVVAAAFISISCVDELISPETQNPEGTVVFTASVDGADTKTVLDGNVSMWSGNEWIQIVGSNGNYWFETTADSPSRKAEFTYSGSFDESAVMAVYPAGSSNYKADLSARTISGVTVPAEQTAVAGSYDPLAAVAVAYSEDRSLSFKNVTALLKFQLASSDVNNVTFWAADSNGNGMVVSGTGTVEYNDGQPVMTGASDKYVALNAPDGGTFASGKTYYIAVLPGTYPGGITIEFNKKAVKSTSKSVTLKRNMIYDLGTIYSGTETGFFTDPVLPDADEPVTVFYRPASDDPLYSQTGDLYAHVWLPDVSGNYGSSWGDNSEKYKLSKVSGQKLWTMTLSPSIRDFFASGTNPVERIGILARTKDKTKQTGDYFIKVTDSKYGVETPSVSMPAGLKHGINYIDESTVTLVLYGLDKNGDHHDFCKLLWDENWWGYSGKPEYPLNWDNDKGCWWITLTDLDPDRNYKFQYQLGYGTKATVTTFDPYTEILYDTYNDGYIPSSVYPGLKAEYGDNHAGRDVGLISAFKINKDEYDWEIDDYQIEDRDDLVIYELLLRDFTDNTYGEGSIKAAIEYLDYIDDLGVNAIELMPVQEFDGNNSWGYGTHAYFAMDKVYGTRNDYKKFIDECHKRGMAVILDVVYNHATGGHPYAAMYWDGTNNKTASNNPWFNADPTHIYNVYHQWNHSNPMVREYVKRNLEYLIDEYKVDGFRFDLSKGFTQNSNLIETYNAERVGYLKEYRSHISSVDPNAVMICEHFVDDENYELGKADIKVWRNMNEAYSESLMGWINSKSDFEKTNGGGLQDINVDWLEFGTLVGYMESHDEERTMYAAQSYGTDGVKADYKLRLKRAGLNAAFFLLVPGPKMIWQFGEIGYDYSITYNGDRTAKKPCVTDDYLEDADRKALYDTYSMLLKFRADNPRFFDGDAQFRWGVGASDNPGRYIFCTNDEGDTFALFGNFGTGEQTVKITLPSDATWYRYDDSSSEWKGSYHEPKMSEGQFYILVDDKSLCKK